MIGTRPAGVSCQRTKPGTFSLMVPLTAGVLGPQQGSLTRSGPGDAVRPPALPGLAAATLRTL